MVRPILWLGLRASGTAYALAEIQQYIYKGIKILYLAFRYISLTRLQIYSVDTKYTRH